MLKKKLFSSVCAVAVFAGALVASPLAIKAAAATYTGYSITTAADTNAGSDDAIELSQHVDVSFSFGHDITVGSGAASAFDITLGGVDVVPHASSSPDDYEYYIQSVTATGLTIRIQLNQSTADPFFALYNGRLTIDSTSPDITIDSDDNAATPEVPITWDNVNTLVNTGTALGTVSSSAASLTTGATVTKQVTHLANVRGMVWFALKKNGVFVTPDSPTSIGGTSVPAMAIHAHTFYGAGALTAAQYANLIVSGGTSMPGNPTSAFGTYFPDYEFDKVPSEDGTTDTFIVKQKDGTFAENDTIDFIVYEHGTAGPIFN